MLNISINLYRFFYPKNRKYRFAGNKDGFFQENKEKKDGN